MNKPTKPKKNDLMRIAYNGGTREEYTGTVEDCNDKNITLKLVGETDKKGKPCYRTFNRMKMDVLFCSN